MDVSNSIAASAAKALLSDKTSDTPANGAGFGQVMSDLLTKAAETNPISDPKSPNSGVEVRTTIGNPADIAKSGAGRMTIADTSPFDLKSETRTTVADPADISKSDLGRTTVADTSAFDKKGSGASPQNGANALERSLSLLLAGQLEAATTRFNGFEALRKSDS